MNIAARRPKPMTVASEIARPELAAVLSLAGIYDGIDLAEAG